MAVLEQLVFDGLALNDATNWRLQAVDMPPPKKRFEWAQGADADGAALIRDPMVENREITCRLRVTQRTTSDLALAAVAALVQKVEDTENQPDGLPLVWTPAGSTKTITFDVLSAEIEELPVSWDGNDAGWFIRSPVLSVKFYCRPFGYGAEVTGPTSGAVTAPVATVDVPSVPGDVPALGRLVVTEGSTQSRRYLEWGLEQRYYTAGAPQSLLMDSDGLATSGFSGAGTTRTGAYDNPVSGNNVIRMTMGTRPLAVCGTGTRSHVGTFRVKARIFTTTLSARLRFAWQEGDSLYRGNDYVASPIAGSFSEVDLGLITIPPAITGTQRWMGRIEAYSLDSTADTIDVDYIVLMPAGEGYGKARGEAITTGGVLTHRDDFDSAAGALAGRVAPAGGTWAGAGSATDFAGSSNAMNRTTLADASLEGGRYATMGTTAPVDVLVEVDTSTIVSGASDLQMGVLARYVDTNNWLRLSVVSSPALGRLLRVQKKVAGTLTTLLEVGGNLPLAGLFSLEVRSDGSWRATHSAMGTYMGADSSLRTGAALATGKIGFYDADAGAGPSTASRYFLSIYGTDLGAPPTVLNSGRTLEVRDDAAIRQDTAGTVYGLVPGYRGSFFKIPPAGDKARTSRVAVKAHREDLERATAEPIGDSITAQVFYTPRYSVVPQ